MMSPNNQVNLQNVQQGKPANNLFIVRISGGRNTAMNYPVSLGYEVFLVDEESKMFFIKSNDSMGRGITLREFSYEETTPEPENTAFGTPNGFDPSKYVTKDDFNALLEEVKKLHGGRDRGHQFNRNNRRSRNGSKPYDESI